MLEGMILLLLTFSEHSRRLVEAEVMFSELTCCCV
jgi:hypothetical protein